jgi:hypothetical protein
VPQRHPRRSPFNPLASQKGKSRAEEIKETALEEAELAEWEDDPPEIVSIEILDDPDAPS